MKKRNLKKKNSQNNFSKLSVFQNNKYKFNKSHLINPFISINFFWLIGPIIFLIILFL